VKDLLSSILRKPSQIIKLARRSGWHVREGKILTPQIFATAVVSCVSSGYCSLREIAIEVGLLTGKTISKQALSERFNASSVEFIKGLVTSTLREAYRALPAHGLENLPRVARILVGDSTTIRLHPSLIKSFPGASSRDGFQSAQLKLQFTFELLTGRWLQAEFGPYCVPDQAAAPDILRGIVRAGDLVIRDLGYAVLEVFEAIGKKGGFYLSRLNPSIVVMTPDGKRVDLLKLASARSQKTNKTFSTEVLLGAAKRLPSRLVIICVPEKIAAQRRRKLKDTAKRKCRKQPTKTYLALQSWEFFVTNLDTEQADDTQLYELYRLRWRVENLFKISKSLTHLKSIAEHRTNTYHVETLLWAWALLMISMGNLGVFRLLEEPARGAPCEAIVVSISKSLERIFAWVAPMIQLAAAGDFVTLMARLAEQQNYHDRYEKRSRLSMSDRITIALKLRSALPLT